MDPDSHAAKILGALSCKGEGVPNMVGSTPPPTADLGGLEGDVCSEKNSMGQGKGIASVCYCPSPVTLPTRVSSPLLVVQSSWVFA